MSSTNIQRHNTTSLKQDPALHLCDAKPLAIRDVRSLRGAFLADSNIANQTDKRYIRTRRYIGKVVSFEQAAITQMRLPK